MSTKIMGDIMHIIGILTSLAFLVYWISRAAGSAQQSGIFAGWHRRKRWDYSNVNAKSEFDALETNLDAAVVLLVAIGRESVSGAMPQSVKQKIVSILHNEMQVDTKEALAKIKSSEHLIRNIVQADSVVLPASKILYNKITREDSRQLLSMLEDVLKLDANPARDKLLLISSYKQRMGFEV